MIEDCPTPSVEISDVAIGGDDHINIQDVDMNERIANFARVIHNSDRYNVAEVARSIRNALNQLDSNKTL
jgi:hypothetical protein